MAKKKKTPAPVEELLIKRNMNIAGYGGKELAVYTAVAASKSGHTVLIIDKSTDNDVLTAVMQEENCPIAERYGITVVDGNIENDSYKKEDYEIHITYYGGNIEEAAKADKKEIQLLVTDMYAEHARLLSQIPPHFNPEEKKKKTQSKTEAGEIMAERAEVPEGVESTVTNPEVASLLNENHKPADFGPQIIVLNDLVKIKYGPKYLLSLAGHKEIKKVYKLNFNPTDFEVKLSIGHEKFSLRDLTENFKMTINELVALIIGCYPDKKQLSKIYKR